MPKVCRCLGRGWSAAAELPKLEGRTREPYIDTTHEWGDLIAAFAAKLAELDRKRIRERVVAGLEAARANGKTLGRPRVVVNRPKVWALRKAGKSIREISATLKLSHGTVQRIVECFRH